jgi:hexosaminidase
MLFPRLLAFSEAVWSPAEGKRYDDFSNRLTYQLARLDQQDVRYRIPEPVGLVDFFTATEDHTRVALQSLVTGAHLYYTLDGSTPTEHDTRYESPFEISLQPEHKTVLNLIVVEPNGRRSVPYTATFLRSGYRDAIRHDNSQPGLAFSVYEGPFSTARDIERAKPVAQGTTVSFDPTQFGRRSNFGVTFDGYLRVPSDGYYRFAMESDDGAVLQIDDSVVVDNDGNHSPRIITGHFPLRQGLHRLSLRYFQSTGGSALHIDWANGESELQPLDGSALYH